MMKITGISMAELRDLAEEMNILPSENITIEKIAKKAIDFDFVNDGKSSKKICGGIDDGVFYQELADNINIQ